MWGDGDQHDAQEFLSSLLTLVQVGLTCLYMLRLLACRVLVLPAKLSANQQPAIECFSLSVSGVPACYLPAKIPTPFPQSCSSHAHP